MTRKTDPTRVPKNEKEWRDKLDPFAYKILREKGTEAPYSGEYVDEKRSGMYCCKACGNQLFSSDSKFDSSIPSLRGWPSFDDALPGAVKFVQDSSLSMNRIEVLCSKCESHLGHIFDDSEAKTGKHFCVNSICLGFKQAKNNLT